MALEHTNLLVSILVEDIHSQIKKQIEDNLVGWVSQYLGIIHVTI